MSYNDILLIDSFLQILISGLNYKKFYRLEDQLQIENQWKTECLNEVEVQ